MMRDKIGEHPGMACKVHQLKMRLSILKMILEIKLSELKSLV